MTICAGVRIGRDRSQGDLPRLKGVAIVEALSGHTDPAYECR